MAGALRSVSIGFQGGQVLAVRVAQAQLDALYSMLGSTGWQSVETDDGPVRLDLSQIVFVRSDDGAHSVGFGA